MEKVKIEWLLTFLLISLMAIPSSAVYSSSECKNENINQFSITNITPDNLTPGELNTVNITIKNIRENPVYDVSVNLSASSSPVFVKNELLQNRPGRIESNQTCTFQYKLYVREDTQKGMYYIPFTVIWTGVSNGVIQIQENLSFGIEVTSNKETSKIDITSIDYPERLKPGDNFTIRIGLKNIGNETAKSIRINLPLDYYFRGVGSDTELFLRDLGPGETSEIEYNLQVDKQAIAGLFKLNLSLEYQTPEGKLISENCGFGINLEDISTVSIDDITTDPSILSPGSEGIFIVSVVNSGTNPIKSVKLMVDGGDDILTQSHNFIGEIKPGESKSTSLGIHVDPDAKIGKYGLNIKVNYVMFGGSKQMFSNLFFIDVIPASSPLPISKKDLINIALVAGLIMLSILIIHFKALKISRLKRNR